MTQDTTEPKTTKIEKLSVNVTKDLLNKLDQLVRLNGPFARRHSIHVAALKLGLAELAAKPDRIHEALGGQVGEI